MQVAFITSELFPFSKTGGLGDVAAALPKALTQQGSEVRVFAPLYTNTKQVLRQLGYSPSGHVLLNYLWIGDHQRQVHFQEVEHDGVHIVFVENDWAFDRTGLYLDGAGKDFADNVGRFSLLCRAVLEYCLQSGYTPDLFHCNDWQSSLLPVYLCSTYKRAQFEQAKSVLTIHNLGYQGIFPAEEIYSAGLGWEWFTPDLLEFHGQLNLLKGGIVCADAITTVSPTYAAEIQHETNGMGLEGLIRHHHTKLTGILNGIDTEQWDPQTDPALAANYGPDTLKRKSTNKKTLQKRLGLSTDPDAFLLGMVTRLDEQKGVGITLDAISKLKQKGIQFALLGSGAPELETRAQELAAKRSGRVGVQIAYDEQLAHLIYAGADALLMPSLYEPCGLNQMYAQRYGTVPIVREVGGLKDTVVGYSARRLAKGQAGGFTFKSFKAGSLGTAIRSAYKLYCNEPQKWDTLRRHIMGIDHSWHNSARLYAALYERLVSAPTETSVRAEA
jgi:starch synthase